MDAARVAVLHDLLRAVERVDAARVLRRPVRRARQELVDAGEKVGKVLIGMMLEVPAAAVSIDSILHAVDFVSIGSNNFCPFSTRFKFKLNSVQLWNADR